MQYAAWLESSGHDHVQEEGGSTVTQNRSPSPSGAPSGDREPGGEGAGMIGRIMAGMLIFFAFIATSLKNYCFGAPLQHTAILKKVFFSALLSPNVFLSACVVFDNFVNSHNRTQKASFFY